MDKHIAKQIIDRDANHAKIAVKALQHLKAELARAQAELDQAIENITERPRPWWGPARRHLENASRIAATVCPRPGPGMRGESMEFQTALEVLARHSTPEATQVEAARTLQASR